MTTLVIIALVAAVISLIFAIVRRRAFFVALSFIFGLVAIGALTGIWWTLVAAIALFLIALFATSARFMRVAAGLGATALVGVMAFSLFANATPPAAADTSGENGIETIAFDPAVDLLPEEAKCATNSFVDHSVRIVEAGNVDKKQFSTAVSIPLKGTDDASVMSEMKDEICGNPTVLVMIVDDMLLWTDSDIPGAESNKGWLQEIRTDLNINSFLEKNEDGSLIVTETYQKYAAWVNTVLLRSVAEGQQSLSSIRNWELSAAWDPTSGLPVAQQASVQESKPAWVRLFKDKNGTCLLKFGFNAEDRRFEIFDCVTPQPEEPAPPQQPDEPAPPTETTPPTTSTPPPDKHTPPPPEKTTPPPSTPKCPWNPSLPPDHPDCLKPKSSDKKDYVYPEGKPPVTIDKPADPAPAPVQTEQPGGRGVVDTPTNPPGSESGVTAPGATPAPTTPAPLPPNEGGDNSGGGGSGSAPAPPDPGGF